jgi:DNA end-binding protein Ku
VAARSTWKGFLKVSLVNIPVRVFPATDAAASISFNQLHRECRTRIQQKRWCPTCQTEVANTDLVKGYEFEKGHFVVLTKEDFAAAALEKTRTVDILDFVKAEEIDDRFFETPYYMLPGKGGERAYALLREAIRTSGRIGISKFILRDAQHLAAVEVIKDALVLSIMRFADELVDAATFTFPSSSTVRPQELGMAKTLVENLAAEWSPAKYTDDYRENLMKVIRAKMKGQKPKLRAEVEPQSADVVDLMERLRQSLQGGSARRPTGARARAAAAHRKPRASAKRATKTRKRRAA